jgi:hypothetical protein
MITVHPLLIKLGHLFHSKSQVLIEHMGSGPVKLGAEFNKENILFKGNLLYFIHKYFSNPFTPALL